MIMICMRQFLTVLLLRRPSKLANGFDSNEAFEI